MRTVQMVAPRTLELREIPQAKDPGAGEVTVRIRAVGICGSDMHWYVDGHIGSTPAVYPQTLGHEPTGEIISVGSGVQDRYVGQRVLVEPAVTCGYCEFCLMGRHNNCVRSIFLGTPQEHGCLREFVTVPAHNAFPIPDSMGLVEATMLEPVAVIVHMLELVKIRLGATVGVMGAGPIGLLTAMVARSAGASKVMLFERQPSRIALAKSLGFDNVFPIEETLSAANDLTNGRGCDVVFDAAAASQSINLGLGATRIAGQFVLVGIPADKMPSVDLHEAMGKEINIQTIRRSNHNTHAAMDLMNSGAIHRGLITHNVPLEQAPRAIESLARYEDGIGKLVIEI